jgi:Lon protease-like protein
MNAGGLMETNYENLPVLPLTSGVLLPGMVFTLALESDEAIAAVEAAEAADGTLVIVPFIDGHYASVGVVAEVAERGELPGGLAAVAIRGVERARLGTAVPGTGQALWVSWPGSTAPWLRTYWRRGVPAAWQTAFPRRSNPAGWPTWPDTPRI